MRLILILFSLLFFSCSKEEISISGTYKNDEILLKIGKDGSNVNGMLEKDGNEYPVKGEVKGSSISGNFSSGEDSYDFNAEVSGDTMSFTTGGTTYKLSKKGKPNPLAKKKKENPLAKKDEPGTENESKDKKTTKTYQIDNSFIFFDYPKEWQVNVQENFLNIAPPNARTDANGEADELVIMSITPANGFQLNDDAVQKFFIQLVNQQFNNSAVLQESGTSKSKLGAGRTFKFSVKSNEGKDATVMVYCTVFNNVSFYVEHAALNDYYDDRSKEAKAIFNSLRLEQAKQDKAPETVKVSGDRDPQLVSGWIHRSNAGNGVVYTESSTKALFQADGKVYWGSGTFISADNGSYSAVSKPGQNPPDEGVWTTKNDIIHITWSNGYKSQYQYSVFQHNGDLAVKMIIDGKTLYFKRY
ncbi:MAG: hypothetical protein NE330_08760 [Lentisphaeraceae bacterium]|nr:hypothetical protein [Lentisphaeraceae bacterium]